MIHLVGITQKMSESSDDFHYRHIFGPVYTTLSAINVILNIFVCFVVFRNQRMRASPKYWLVLVISFTFISQALGPNSVVSVTWFTGHFPSPCWIWTLTVIYGNYIAVAIVNYTALLTNVDFLLCLLSSPYSHKHRRIGTVTLMVTFYTVILGTIIPLIVFFGEAGSSSTDEALDKHDTGSSTTCTFYMDSPATQYALLWITVFVPAILSTISCVVIYVCRCSRSVQRYFGVNVDIVYDSMDTEVSKTLPPGDHLLFLLLTILMYFPFSVANYGEVTCQFESCPALYTFMLGCSTLSDNAGVILPLAWFFFKDMRRTVRKMFPEVSTRSDSIRITSQVSELAIYDTYPYCLNTQC